MSTTHSPVELSSKASRYHYALPDFDANPDPYNRTWILLDWIGTRKRVLELGCSTGFMSQYMTERRGCRVTGVEVDEEAAQQAARFCQRVLARDLNRPDWDADIEENSFDVVLMGDVLEHLAHPNKLLLRIRRLLAADGSIVVCLPNALHWITRMNFLVGRFDYEAGGTLDHTHLRFFTLKTARHLIENAGFRITKFHPAFGGRLAGHARPVWQRLARWFPGLFAFQVLFEAKIDDSKSVSEE